MVRGRERCAASGGRLKAFQAYAAGNTATAETPLAAGQKFFQNFPNKRKCSVIEGNVDGPFFQVRYGSKAKGEWPRSWKDVTKKTVDTLPNL